MDKNKSIFSTLNSCNSKQIFVGDDRSLRVVGSRKIQIDDDHCKYVLICSMSFMQFVVTIRSIIPVKEILYIFHLIQL